MKGIFRSNNFTHGITFFVLSLLMTNLAQGQKNTPFLPQEVHAVSTVPANGDLNPYGVVFVPPQFIPGTTKPGDILVSNFNNNSNLQGTGTTIIDIPQSGQTSVFFQGTGLMGFTTALNVLKRGFVLVGNFPSPDGTCGNAQNGSILVINNNGKQIQSISDPNFINGPWNSTVFDQGGSAKLFIANGLTGKIVRLDLSVSVTNVTVIDKTQIASGYQHQCDPVTFVNAPTGLVYDSKTDILYVASTMDNAIYAIPNAAATKQDMGRGSVIFSDNKYLHGPLAMIMAPNGHLVVSNNDTINPNPKHVSALTEFTTQGKFVKEITVDSNPGGAFGLNIENVNGITRFAAVDDNQNLLLIWYLSNVN